MSFWSSWPDVLPTGNVCMGSPILMTSVHDIAVGNEWQPRDANGFFLTTAVWPRLSGRSSGGVASLLLPVLVPHAFCTSGVPCAPLLRFWHQAHLRVCRLLDFFHHRAACANVGVSGRRGFALESVAARVCREAGGRVSVNQYVRDLDTAPNNRRLEVVADGLFLFHGAQLVIDTMMVSPLSLTRVPHARCADIDGAATMAARRRKQRRCPELAGEGGRALLVVLVCEVGGRFSKECRHFLRQMSKFKARDEPLLLQQRMRHARLHRWGSKLACSGARGLMPTLAKPTLAPKKIDRLRPTLIDRLWPNLAWPTLAKPTFAKIGVLVFWPNHPSTRGRGAGDPFEPASRRVGPEGWGAQNFAFFFSHLPPQFSFFLPLLGVLALNFGGV